MRTLFGAACAIAALAGTPAFAQSTGGYYSSQGGYQDQSGYPNQGGYYQANPQNPAAGNYNRNEPGYQGQPTDDEDDEDQGPPPSGYYQGQAQPQDQQGYDQSQAQYQQQRQQYEDSRRAYQQRREDYEANRQTWEQNRDTYRENQRQYRREYRRWVRGAYLPYEYRNRWGTIPNWTYYHLHRPGHGYVWVYDGESYLLINRSTGYIADVVGPNTPYYVPYR